MLTLKEVQSVFPNLRDAALLLLLQNPGWTPRQMRQYRKIDRALSDALYTVYSQMYTARWFNYPEKAWEQGGKKGGIMDGLLTPTGRLVANREVSNLLLPGPYSYTSSPSLVITRQHYYNILFKFGDKKESNYAPGVPVRRVPPKAKSPGNKPGSKPGSDLQHISPGPVYPALAGHDRYPNPRCFCRACKEHRAEASRLNQLGLGSEPNVPATQAGRLGGAVSNKPDVGSIANSHPRTWTDVGVLVNSQRFDRPVVQGAGKSEPDQRAEHVDKGILLRQNINQLVLDWARWHDFTPLLTNSREALVKQVTHLIAELMVQELASAYSIVAQARAELSTKSQFGELAPLAKLEFELAERRETYQNIAKG